MNNYFSSNLKVLRKAKNISQTQLADLVERSHSAVSSWEAKKSYPNVEDLILIANYLNISIDHLLLADLREEAPKGPLDFSRQKNEQKK